MKKNMIDFAKRLEIFKALEKVCVKDESREGFCYYTSGVSDETLAHSLGVTESNVRGLRQEMFGKLKVAKNPESADLERRVTQIEEYLTRKNPAWRDAV